MERIVIKFVERPDSNDPDKMLKWFCDVFGLSSGDSSDSIEEQILKKFIEAAHDDKGLSSSELKLETDLARSTVIYHLNRFIEVGLLVKHGRKYHLRASEMAKAIEEIEYDLSREMQRMLDTAKQLDKFTEAWLSDAQAVAGKEKGAQKETGIKPNKLFSQNPNSTSFMWSASILPNGPTEIKAKKGVSNRKRKGAGKK
jgi:hypothetical protein